jgi:hypothetical protein
LIMNPVTQAIAARRASTLGRVAAVALTATLLSACRDTNPYTSRRDTIRLGAGDAMAHNRAVHTIDPWPVHARDTRIDVDGKRMLVAVERYQANESIEPSGEDTADQFQAGDGPPPPPPAPPAP